ncbi:MAG: hypothetical protein ACOC9Z_06780 [Chloroflexota bacterium]
MASNEGNRWKGLVLGFFGGIVGLLAMRIYWQKVQQLTGHDPRTDYDESDVPDTEALDDISVVGKQKKEGESTTAAMGRILYDQFKGEEPGEETKSALSYLVHWLIGMSGSAVYGAMRTKAPVVDVEGSLGLATGLWLFGDELTGPLLGLSPGPTAYPPQMHLHTWGAHVAYGVASALATQLLYRLAP